MFSTCCASSFISSWTLGSQTSWRTSLGAVFWSGFSFNLINQSINNINGSVSHHHQHFDLLKKFNQSNYQPIYQTIKQSNYQTITIKQSNYQTIKQSNNQTILSNNLIKQSYQTILSNNPIKQSYQTIKLLINQTINQSNYQSISFMVLFQTTTT